MPFLVSAGVQEKKQMSLHSLSSIRSVSPFTSPSLTSLLSLLQWGLVKGGFRGQRVTHGITVDLNSQ